MESAIHETSFQHLRWYSEGGSVALTPNNISYWSDLPGRTIEDISGPRLNFLFFRSADQFVGRRTVFVQVF